MDFFPNFDEQRDAVFSLKIMSELLKKTEENPQYWKWVMIALHSSLQGFMVLVLKGSDNLAIMEDGKGRWWGTRKAWFEYFFRKKPIPKAPKLVSFSLLYDRIQSPHFMKQRTNSQVFKPTPSQTQSVNELNNDIRNEFIHFFSKRWSDSAMSFLIVVNDCVEIISFLALDSNNISWFPESLQSDTNLLISQVKQQSAAIEREFNERYGPH